VSTSDELVAAVRAGDLALARAVRERLVSHPETDLDMLGSSLAEVIASGDPEAAVAASGVIRDLGLDGVGVPSALVVMGSVIRGPDARRRAWAWEAAHGLMRTMAPEDFGRDLAPLFTGTDPQEWASLARNAARRGLPIGPALPGLVALAGSGDPEQRMTALSALRSAAAGDQDLDAVLPGLRALASRGRTVDELTAEVLARAELAAGRWERLEGLLGHESPAVRRAATSVARELLDAALAGARASGDVSAMKRLLQVRRALRG
jgi:hypothetical protein